MGNTGDSVKSPTLQARIVDETFRLLMILIYIVCSQLVFYCLPWGMGEPLYFVLNCWLASLYCFEYRWVFLGWSSRERLGYFERHYLYFAGFGFPIAFASYVSPRFIDNGIFALIFPVFILTAAVAQPRELAGATRWKRLQIFWLVSRITTKLLSFCDRRRSSSSSGTSSSTSSGTSLSTSITSNSGGATGSGASKTSRPSS